MKRAIYFLLCIIVAVFSTNAQNKLIVQVNKPTADIQPTMWGLFFEDINFAADGGLYAELVKNRSFEFTDPMMGWTEPNSDRHSLNLKSGKALPVAYAEKQPNRYYLRVIINDDNGYELVNEGFRGMGIRQNDKYNFSFMAKVDSGVTAVKCQLINQQNEVIASGSATVGGDDWKNYETAITASATCPKAKLKITFVGNGTIDLDMVSLFPQDTWKGRKNGLRKDLVQLLYNMHPGFLRFPGGCIVEGRTLDRRYQWKKTVGPIEDRPTLVNRWNTEFAHRLTPDYYQSFGLGFFEYFQLAEDIGAEPLPILNCGMACQYNTGELVPLGKTLDPYVQDALDLIEFANGDVTTKWGNLRAEMGHPKPFNLKYIGIGNEQWGKDYFDRYVVFEKAIKDKYPDMKIVSGSGPSAEGDYFDYGWKRLKKLNASLVDEHYYKSPEWFRNNAKRYDNYDRKGPKVFAGEYAAQSVAIASPNNKNNWECAMSEAAFMTGLERNADVVNMASYAPLFANINAWQWTPDLIWFDNIKSYGTPNYYVQKMYATNKGNKVVPITLNKQEIAGQDSLYATACIDTETHEVIVKLVNTSSKSASEKIQLRGVSKLASKGTVQVMSTTDLNAENSLDKPMNISPKTSDFTSKGKTLNVELKPYSFTIYRIGYK